MVHRSRTRPQTPPKRGTSPRDQTVEQFRNLHTQLLHYAAEIKSLTESEQHKSSAVAQELGWSEERAQLIFDAAPMHDVGKIGVPDSILLKQGPLTPKDRFAAIYDELRDD